MIRWTYRTHLDDLREDFVKLNSVPMFENYLHWSPEMAKALGFPQDLDDRLANQRVSNVRLSISVDGVEKPLKDMEQLTVFLDSHPDIAMDLQYR